MKFEVFFDLETKNLFSDINSKDPADLGVSIVSLYSRRLSSNGQESSGQIISYWEKDFNQIWPIFQKADRIIGFNTLHFDIPALQPYTYIDLAKLPHFDMLDQIKNALGRRLGLDLLARNNLSAGKSDIGIKAVYYWREGGKKNLTKLQKYCEDDVIITRDLYDFVLKNKFLKYTDRWNNPRQFDIDFSYPESDKKEGQEKQIGLF
jgi:hypothetical protein